MEVWRLATCGHGLQLNYTDREAVDSRNHRADRRRECVSLSHIADDDSLNTGCWYLPAGTDQQLERTKTRRSTALRANRLHGRARIYHGNKHTLICHCSPLLQLLLAVSIFKRTFTFAICYRPSFCCLPVCLSSVCLSSVTFVRAPYSGGSNFRRYFYGIRYLRHLLTSTENFTEIVKGEPLRRGS